MQISRNDLLDYFCLRASAEVELSVKEALSCVQERIPSAVLLGLVRLFGSFPFRYSLVDGRLVPLATISERDNDEVLLDYFAVQDEIASGEQRARIDAELANPQSVLQKILLEAQTSLQTSIIDGKQFAFGNSWTRRKRSLELNELAAMPEGMVFETLSTNFVSIDIKKGVYGLLNVQDRWKLPYVPLSDIFEHLDNDRVLEIATAVIFDCDPMIAFLTQIVLDSEPNTSIRDTEPNAFIEWKPLSR